MDEAKHNCGIAAVYMKENGESANKALFYLYKLLLHQQNRGQLSAGITTYNKDRPQILDTHKDLGTVNEVFKTSNKLESLQIFKRFAGNKGIGHTRYATSGSESKELAQPFVRRHGRMWKWFSFGFNGNLSNYAELKEELLKKSDYHIIFDTDTEIIMHYIARELKGSKRPNLVKVFSNLTKKFDGCYNLVFMNAFGEMIILRDPSGFRPLVYGEKNGMFLAAAESNALVNCGITDIKHLAPGHLIHIHDDKIEIKKFADSPKKSHCMFEWVYFANVSSNINEKSVYVTRKNLGKQLAQSENIKIDNNTIIVPVPDTAKASGDSMAYELRIQPQEGLIRNRFVGRTFIEGSNREDRIQNKYTALREILAGRKIILVDDSVVRGATTKQLIKYLKEVGGAKEVHLRVSCPPIRGPCFYGIDMSTIGELLIPQYEGKPATGEVPQKIIDRVAKDLGADSMKYQTIQGLIDSIGLPAKDLCTACVSGEYPTKGGKRLYKKAWENYRKGVKERTYSC